MTPNKEHLRLWVKALRSGHYRQGTGSLRSVENRHCCLGVACEVAIANGLDIHTQLRARSEIALAVYTYDGISSVLPYSVREWLGLTRNDPPVTRDEFGVDRDATYVNDLSLWDFNKIADSIEAYYELNEEES